MKTSILISAIVACALSAPIAFAQEKPAPANPAMNMDNDKQMAPMPENIKKMQEQMDKIGTTTDPKERQKLMQEHMKTMQENMKEMRGMSGSMPKSRGEKGGMAMGDKKGGMATGGMAMGGMAMGGMAMGEKKSGQKSGAMPGADGQDAIGG